MTYYSAITLLKVCLLCATGAYSAEVTDDMLEQQISRQFREFRGATISSTTGVCKAVQFIYTLMQSDDANLSQKLALLLSRGAGVGGIANRQATEDERAMMFMALNKAKQNGAKRGDFVTDTTDSDLAAHHQAYLGTVYDVLSEQSTETATPAAFDFIGDKSAYHTFNTHVKLGYAVKTDNWQELSKEVPNPEEFKRQAEKVRTYYVPKKEQVQVMRHLITVSDGEREDLITRMHVDEVLRPKPDPYDPTGTIRWVSRTLDVDEMVRIAREKGVVQLRPLKHGTLVVGCGNNGISCHKHATADTIDSVCSQNPTIIGSYPYPALNVVPDNQYSLIVFERLSQFIDTNKKERLKAAYAKLKDGGMLAILGDLQSYCVEARNIFQIHLHTLTNVSKGTLESRILENIKNSVDDLSFRCHSIEYIDVYMKFENRADIPKDLLEIACKKWGN